MGAGCAQELSEWVRYRNRQTRPGRRVAKLHVVGLVGQYITGWGSGRRRRRRREEEEEEEEAEEEAEEEEEGVDIIKKSYTWRSP